MALGAIPIASVNAEDTVSTEPYPYTMFAASYDEGAISINADNFGVNGSIETNGTIVSSGNMNVNGTRAENADESMIFIFDKIDNQYFSASNVEEYDEDFTLDELNININVPTEVQGEATLTGNININNALKALEDVNLYGEVKNTNDSVIFSKYGDINIESENVNLNGLIYAPFGCVNINAKNLNLNSVVIIADSIVLTCPSVNANNSSNASSFVGKTSDLLDIPYDEWQYMKDENENDFPDFFEYYDNWRLLKDTDGDHLPDCVEQFIGIDATLTDTDGDMLDDYYEAFVTATDPTKPDTDGNGVADGDEDFDSDGLTNYQEYVQGTSPWDSDSDSDNLNDGDEVNTYGTNPLEPDTDFDGLSDADEVALGTNPNLADTDGNGTPDGEEKFDQTYVYDVENKDCAVEQVIVSMQGTGNLQNTTKIKSVMNKDKMCSDVVGLVGEPFSIKTSSQFDSATLSFKIDKTKLGETDFNDLMFLWYDEENNEFVDLDTIYDSENSIVTIETDHFSKYMVVDKYTWFENWRNIYNSYKGVLSQSPSKTAICVDCSGSMSSNDPITIIPPSINGCERYKAVSQFINAAYDNDKISIITFENSASTKCELTNDKTALYWASTEFYNGGGTNANSAVEMALEQLKNETGNKNIILLSDGDVNVTDTNINTAITNNVKIFTIGLGSGADNSTLKYYADATGGYHYATLTASELEEIYNALIYLNKTDFSSLKDSDTDGLPDVMEQELGIPLPNGQLVFTNPEKKDTDGDKLTDGQEVNESLYIQKMLTLEFGEEIETIEVFVFKPTSDPTKIDTDDDGLNDYDELLNVANAFNPDTDDDGLLDSEDPNVNRPNVYYRYNRQASVDYALKWGEGRNPEYREYITDCANFVSQCIFNGELVMNQYWYCYYNGIESMGDFLLSFDWVKFGVTQNDKYIEEWNIAPAWRLAKNQYEYFSRPQYCENEYIVESADDIEELVKNGLVEPGDLAYCSDKHHRKNPYHATFISYVEDNNIFYAAHTDDYVKRDMKKALEDNSDKNMTFTIIHMKDLIIYE